MVLRKTAGTILQEVHGKNPDTTARILWKRPLVILHGILWKNPDITARILWKRPQVILHGILWKNPDITITGPPEEAEQGIYFIPGYDPV